MKSTRKPSIKTILLWSLLGLSLLLNIVTLFLLNWVRLQSIEVLENARTVLEEIQQQPIKTVVDIDQAITLNETLPFQHTFSVPVDTTYPLSTTIRTTVQIPLLGVQEIAVPVQAQIPIQMDMDIPVDTEVPIDFTYQLQTSIPIEVHLPSDALAPVDSLLQNTLERLR
jgi:hypothetical protein